MTLKEPPLLKKPDSEQSPWMEITPKQISVIKANLGGAIVPGRYNPTWGFLFQLVSMQRLKVNVDPVLEGQEKRITTFLKRLSPIDHDYTFAGILAFMKELGWDVKEEVTS